MCIGFDIGVEEIRVDENREYPVLRRAKDLAPSQSDQQRDSHPRKRIERRKDNERHRLRRLEREQERKYGNINREVWERDRAR